jgi:hypothetical protein
MAWPIYARRNMRRPSIDYPLHPFRSIIDGSDNLSLWTGICRRHDDGGGAVSTVADDVS